MSDEKPPPPPYPTTIRLVPSTPVVTWEPDYSRVAVYNVTPLSVGERAELEWLRLPWWRRWTTRKPSGNDE